MFFVKLVLHNVVIINNNNNNNHHHHHHHHNSEVSEHEFSISLDAACQNRWKNTADVTVQKAAHRILLYGFTHNPSRSPSLWVPFTCLPGRSGPGKCSAFTESTTRALVASLGGRSDLPQCNKSSASRFSPNRYHSCVPCRGTLSHCLRSA